jgi:hypothetical protein
MCALKVQPSNDHILQPKPNLNEWALSFSYRFQYVVAFLERARISFELQLLGAEFPKLGILIFKKELLVLDVFT